jgi:hypothetical protein
MSDQSLSGYFRDQANWRDLKAEEYPEDARNAQSAAALRSLADYVESGERETVNAVQALEPFEYGSGVLIGGPAAGRAVSRYGYGYPVTVSSHQEFLTELVVLCIEGAYEQVGEQAGEGDPSGTLYDFEVEAAKDGVVLGPHYFRLRSRMLPDELEGLVQESRESADLEDGA